VHLYYANWVFGCSIIYYVTFFTFRFWLIKYSFFQFPTYNNLQHPEIHTFMLQHGLLAKTMNYFLTKVGSPLNFTITDLLTPTPARHRQILNELVNCLLFAGKIQHFAETAWENRKAREEKLQTLRDEVNHLKNHKAHQLHERGVREDKIKDVRMNTNMFYNNLLKLFSVVR